MNGTQSKIEIFKPFGEAYEMMVKILFKPFDFKKWCVIGFAAFLANLGGGFSFRYNWNPRGTAAEGAEWQNIVNKLHEIPSWIWISGLTIAVFGIIALIIVFAWLRARGAFMFADCIVKNRGAIAEPWREFKKQGNSLFLFSLVVGLAMLGCVILLALPFLLPIFSGTAKNHAHGVFLISMLVLWVTAFFLIVIAWMLIAQMMVAIMYRQRCRAAEGFRGACRLISNYPGEIVLYCLFWIVLGLAVVMVSCLATCATCCLTAIPYVGTVILLPLFVCLRAFSLLFVRQFGPEYDVWETLPKPEQPPPLPVRSLA